MKECIAKAKAAGCDLIVFPELAIPGYLIGDIWDQPDYIDDCVRFGEEIKALSDGMAIIFGNVAKETDRVNLDGRTRKYNAMFIAYNGRWISPARSPYPSTSRRSCPTTANSATSATSRRSSKSPRNAMPSRKTSCRPSRFPSTTAASSAWGRSSAKTAGMKTILSSP